MDEGRRQFLKKVGLWSFLLLLAPIWMFKGNDLFAPFDDVQAYKEYLGIADGDDELEGLEELDESEDVVLPS